MARHLERQKIIINNEVLLKQSLYLKFRKSIKEGPT